MIKVTVFGPGCAKCKQTEKLVRAVVEEMKVDADVQKVADFQTMAQAGVLMTPAVAVNGVVKVSGRIPKEDEIKSWLARL